MQRAFFSPALELSAWHRASGCIPFDALAIIHEHVAPEAMPASYQRSQTFQKEAIKLRGQVDALKPEKEELEVALSVATLEPTHLHRHLDDVRAIEAPPQRWSA